MLSSALQRYALREEVGRVTSKYLKVRYTAKVINASYDVFMFFGGDAGSRVGRSQWRQRVICRYCRNLVEFHVLLLGIGKVQI